MADQATPAAEPAAELERVHLWDPVVRLCHWVLTVSFVGAWWTGMYGPNVMTWHFYFGYAVIGAVAVRLVWALIGPESARLTGYFYGPGTTVRYLAGMFRRQPSRWRGHNPLAGPIMLVMLLVVGAAGVTGLFIDPDDFVNVGPLAHLVDRSTHRAMTTWHIRLADWSLVLIAIHIAGISFYTFWKRENVILPMITGRKLVAKRPSDKTG